MIVVYTLPVSLSVKQGNIVPTNAPESYSYGYHFLLPLPPTQNNSLVPIRTRKGSTRQVDCREVKDWRIKAADWLDEQYPVVVQPFYKRTLLYPIVHLALPDAAQQDEDNRKKKIFDILKGTAYGDDSQIVGGHGSTVLAANMKWEEGMDPLLRINQTDSVKPHAYVHILPLSSVDHVDPRPWREEWICNIR